MAETNPDGRVAVIDIGSNTVRLVVYDRPRRLPIPMFNEKAPCELGRGLSQSGHLNPDGVVRALRSLARFIRLAGAMGVASLNVVATAAVREAEDGAEFAAKVEDMFGLTVEVLSGAEEARLAALGLLSGVPGADGLLGDLGGGSLDLVTLDDGVFGDYATLPLGHLRLAEAADGDAMKAADIVAGSLASIGSMMDVEGRSFYAVGGSWRTLAHIFIDQTGYSLRVIDNYTIARDDALRLARLVGGLSHGTIEKITGIQPKRIETLPFAAKALEVLLETARPRDLVFSGFGMREGRMLEGLPAEVRRQDPLISGCIGLAEHGGRFSIDGERILEWMSPLFAGETPSQRRLRLAACLISDIGWSEHPDYRAEHALRRALRLPFAGLAHADRGVLGLAVYIRYNGDEWDPELTAVRNLLEEGQLDWVRTVGLALRLAHTLSGGAPGLLSRTSLKAGKEKLTLKLPENHGERDVFESDTVERRLKTLARSMGLKGRVV